MQDQKDISMKDKSIQKLSDSLGRMYDEAQIKVIHETVAKNTTMTELAYFLNVARSVGLNPFNKEIWCYKDYKNNLIIFSGRDGFLKKAQENPKYGGIRSSEVKTNDEFEIDIANNKIVHKITNPTKRGDIVGAYAIVFRKGGEPTVTFVEFSRYVKTNGFSPWKSHPEDMIKKVAELKALKLAFGIANIQTEEDFNISGGIAKPPKKIKNANSEVVNDVKKAMDKARKRKEDRQRVEVEASND